MAKRSRESDSDGITISMAERSTVFVDTNLDTHLAMVVSSSDTISDFKERMVLDHLKCFPTFGEIQIQSLKVKRRSYFYHLTDIMLVSSAFQGVQGDWFLSVDASRAPVRGLNQNASGHGITYGVKVKDSDDFRGVTADAGQTKAVPMTLPDDVCEKDGASEMTAGVNSKKSLEKTPGLPRDGYSEENSKVSHAKKKRKTTHTNDVRHNTNLQGSCNLVRVLSDLRNHQSIIEATAENSNIDSDQRKDDVMLDNMAPEKIIACKQEHKLGKNVPTESPGTISGVLPDYSARLIDGSGTMEDVNSDSCTRTKKKGHKMVSEIHDKTNGEQAGKGEKTNIYTEIHKPDEKEEEKNVSVSHDHEVAISSDKKASGYAVPVPVQRESVEEHTDDVMEPEIKSNSNTKKIRKKRTKEQQSANTNLENSGIEQMDNGITGSSGLVFPPTNLIPEANDTKEGNSHHQVQDVKMKVLNSSANDASKKDQSACGNDADFVALTQSSQTDVANVETILEKTSRSSAGNCHEDLPPIEKDKWCNQVDQNNRSTENNHQKARMKRKKAKLRASDNHESLTVKIQKVGTEVLKPDEALVNLVGSKDEVGHVTSTTPSNKSEEKAEKMNRTAVETEAPANFLENETVGINFKQYFVSGQSQGEDNFGHRKKKAAKLKVKKTNKTFLENDVPSASISTELQNSLKAYENQETEYKSHDKDISGRRAGDALHNSDLNEVISNSSTVPGVDVEGSHPSVKQEMKSVKKTDGSLAALPYPKEKYRTLNKAGSDRSMTLLENRGSKGLQSGLNANKKMMMKTEQKKSLLTKSGTIFQDNSGESSVDEYETVHSNRNIHSPSDSSSLSSHSETVGESDLSQDSPRNGSNDKKELSTVGKTLAKLDLSAAKDMSMEMILKSSKRFKKAKLLASQNNLEENDSQLPEFVPI